MNFSMTIVLQIINILLLVSWPVLSIISLVKIRNRNLSSTPNVIWALMVIGVPILGAIAFFIINPTESTE